MKKILSTFIMAFIAITVFSTQASAQQAVGVQNNTSVTISVLYGGVTVNNVAPLSTGSTMTSPSIVNDAFITINNAPSCSPTLTATFSIPGTIPSPYYTQQVVVPTGCSSPNLITVTIYVYPTGSVVIQVN